MVQLIGALKETAVFLLGAQVLLHLGPGKKYEKYVKMIVSLLVLAQLAGPLLKLAKQEAQAGFLESLERYEKENEAFAGRLELKAGGEDKLFLESLVSSVEEKLGGQAADAGVRIDRVTVEEGRLVIEVGPLDMAGRNAAKPGGEAADKAGTPESRKAVLGNAKIGRTRQDLAERFSGLLGIPAENLEVVEVG